MTLDTVSNQHFKKQHIMSQDKTHPILTPIVSRINCDRSKKFTNDLCFDYFLFEAMRIQVAFSGISIIV